MLHRSSLLSLLALSASVRAAPSDNIYDYLVVGGGTAGLTLASRLTENDTIRVAVIEAGSFYELDTGNISQVPANAGIYNGKSPELTNPLVEWGFMTTPQAGLNGQSVHYPRGKTLGGSSAIHAMAYQRPSTGSMDLWAERVNDSSWSWDNIFPYFQKSIDFTPPNNDFRFANSTPEYDPETLSTGGDLSVTHPNYAQPFSSWMAEAFEAEGIENGPGFTGGHLNGSGWLIHTINKAEGTRESSETAFLAPILNRRNLILLDRTRVERILFDGQVATGVEASDLTTNKTFSLRARREVIMAAGAFQSPQLLMVSGVGPADVLAEHGIPLVADRPGVGQNMQDHIFFGISYRVNLETANSLSIPEIAAQATELYEEKAGPLSAPGGDYAAFEWLPEQFRGGLSEKTEEDLAGLPSDWPEILYLALPAYVGDFYNPLTSSPNDGYNYATMLATLLTPHSRGNVSISSSRMADPPLINPNWLVEEMDIEILSAAFRRLRYILDSDALAGVRIGEEYYPGTEVDDENDDAIRNFVRDNAYTVSHAVATCRMGVTGDEKAVLDSQGRVFGTERLRVVDSSSFPFIPPSLPQSIIYMLAEKIADDIKSTW
ncbi:putative choline dehydrogenase [Aspergillus karnatakaensis]|uniref:GMC family oxidoreductase n=1 Tax=Aspergillus karnatakaensis TaxID=1810916 RepID=UPI003CCCE63A